MTLTGLSSLQLTTLKLSPTIAQINRYNSQLKLAACLVFIRYYYWLEFIL
ncbi:hypothetical protein SPHINGO8BC_10048 [Sphingobacterium multivorum]|uniref:Uncharacterized protein n=1 Tax=Sphingobacterium multivorum TaxID=28454 RepID=A0A653XL29_SPHMU|nr:hypothetical protein SPHINGO8BC_10048 [Sphingobacterium multivorum]